MKIIVKKDNWIYLNDHNQEFDVNLEDFSIISNNTKIKLEEDFIKESVRKVRSIKWKLKNK